MKKSSALILSLLLTACVQHAVYTPAPQQYRAKGDDKQIQITGKLEQELKTGLVTDELTSVLTVYFDGIEQIKGNLDRMGTAEITGKQFNGKNTSASCSTKPVTKTTAETRCIIFIDNERATTLTM